MGDLLDVAEGVVAVEPGETAGGWNAQQEHPAWTQDAGRFGQRLLLEHRQRQLVKQNNRVVRRVRVWPGDDRWHKRDVHRCSGSGTSGPVSSAWRSTW